MTFEEYWSEIEGMKVLPNTAIKQLPSSLSPDTKKRLLKKKPKETVEILKNAIDEINHGSVESIDCLVRKKI